MRLSSLRLLAAFSLLAVCATAWADGTPSGKLDSGTTPSGPSTPNTAPEQTPDSPTLGRLLAMLKAEAEASAQDWRTLLSELARLQTEQDALSSSLEQSRKRYETLASTLASEREASAAAIAASRDDAARAMARERIAWGVALAAGIGLVVTGVAIIILIW